MSLAKIMVEEVFFIIHNTIAFVGNFFDEPEIDKDATNIVGYRFGQGNLQPFLVSPSFPVQFHHILWDLTSQILLAEVSDCQKRNKIFQFQFIAGNYKNLYCLGETRLLDIDLNGPIKIDCWALIEDNLAIVDSQQKKMLYFKIMQS